MMRHTEEHQLLSDFGNDPSEKTKNSHQLNGNRLLIKLHAPQIESLLIYASKDSWEYGGRLLAFQREKCKNSIGALQRKSNRNKMPLHLIVFPICSYRWGGHPFLIWGGEEGYLGNAPSGGYIYRVSTGCSGLQDITSHVPQSIICSFLHYTILFFPPLKVALRWS